MLNLIHVFCKLNKCVDAIVTAASWSVMDGIAAVNDFNRTFGLN